MAEEKEDAQEVSGNSKKKLIFIIIGVLLMVGISVGITIMLLSGDEATEEVVEEDSKPEKGTASYINLKPFTVNLGPEDPVGFLQVQIQILTYYSEVSEDLETHKPLIRNNLTLLFGQQESADLRSPEGKKALQKKVLEAVQAVINQYGKGGEVDNVFFTNFVMQ